MIPDKTDKEIFTEMLDRAGVCHSFSRGGASSNYELVTIHAKDGPNNEGYAGFITEFYFTQEGQLLKVALWE